MRTATLIAGRLGRWLGPAVALLGVGLGLAASLLFSPGYPATRAFIDDAMGWMSVVPVAYLPVCLVAAALAIHLPAEAETLSGLRQDGRPGAQIFGGLVERIRVRTCLLEALMLWLPAGLFAGGIDRQFYLPSQDLHSAGGVFSALALTVGSWAAAALLVVGFRLVGMVLEELGVWIGLRWPERRVGIALGSALGALALAAGTIALGWVMGGDSSDWSMAGCVIVLVGWLAVMAWLRLVLRAKAGRLIDALPPVQEA